MHLLANESKQLKSRQYHANESINSNNNLLLKKYDIIEMSTLLNHKRTKA